MAKTVTFEFETGDTVFYATLMGIVKNEVISAHYSSHTDQVYYRLEAGGKDFPAECLFSSTADLRKNLPNLGEI